MTKQCNIKLNCNPFRCCRTIKHRKRSFTIKTFYFRSIKLSQNPLCYVGYKACSLDLVEFVTIFHWLIDTSFQPTDRVVRHIPCMPLLLPMILDSCPDHRYARRVTRQFYIC